MTVFDEGNKLLVKYGKAMLAYDIKSDKWDIAGEDFDPYITFCHEYDMENLRSYAVHVYSLISFGKKKKQMPNLLES
ncbi:hypothetical protein CDL15_Pgr005437 [Punica granatum]|uniref:Uncharacterized protein n=1 Tax=Punica granatum TaxID=22663 RepID=A0A218WUX8_PUNGR|nr:hypothetical protein CDL15_Pgr005437 [Punica granatum]